MATEERFEAMLAAGRHVDAVAGLERLAAEQPLRERVLGLLMLALYRSGRRADALGVYDAARRRLSEQLGIEPGEPLRRLHAAILEGGATEGDTAAGVDLEAPRRRRFPARAIALAGAALLAVAVAVAALATHGGGSARIVRLHGDSVGLIQPASGHVVGQFNVGAVPSQVVADAHTAWTLNAARSDGVQGRPRHRARPFDGDRRDADGHGARPWVAVGVLRESAAHVRHVRDRRAPPRPRHPPTTCQIPLAARTLGGGPLPVLVSPDGVWLGASGSAYRVDPTRDRRDVRVPISDPRFGRSTVLALARLRGAIWALTDARSIVRIDPTHRKAHILTRLTAPSYGTMVAGAGSLWVTDSFGVWRLNLGPRPQPHDITTGVDALGSHLRRRRSLGDEPGHGNAHPHRPRHRAPAIDPRRRRADGGHRVGGRRPRHVGAVERGDCPLVRRRDLCAGGAAAIRGRGRSAPLRHHVHATGGERDPLRVPRAPLHRRSVPGGAADLQRLDASIDPLQRRCDVRSERTSVRRGRPHHRHHRPFELVLLVLRDPDPRPPRPGAHGRLRQRARPDAARTGELRLPGRRAEFRQGRLEVRPVGVRRRASGQAIGGAACICVRAGSAGLLRRDHGATLRAGGPAARDPGDRSGIAGEPIPGARQATGGTGC